MLWLCGLSVLALSVYLVVGQKIMAVGCWRSEYHSLIMPAVWWKQRIFPNYSHRVITITGDIIRRDTSKNFSQHGTASLKYLA